MGKEPKLPAVNELIVQTVMEPESIKNMDEAQKEAVLKEAEHLPVHWLLAAAQRTTKASMKALVHTTQKLIVYLLNRLNNDHSESKSGLNGMLKRRLMRFLHFLENNCKKHFDFDSPMPYVLWKPIRTAIRQAIFPGEGYCLRDTEAILVAILHEECRESIGTEKLKHREPSFQKGYYWALLMEHLRQRLPVNDATLQTIYTLISCNFNSPAFIQYIIDAYGKDLDPAVDASDFWRMHLVYLHEVVEEPQMSLNPSMDTCKKLLFNRMHNEIQLYAYTKQTQQFNASSVVTLPTTLNGAELALWQKLKMEAKMVETDNKREYFRKVAQVYGMAGSQSEDYLYDKHYRVDAATKERIMTYLADMRRILSELSD